MLENTLGIFNRWWVLLSTILKTELATTIAMTCITFLRIKSGHLVVEENMSQHNEDDPVTTRIIPKREAKEGGAGPVFQQ